MRLYLRFSSFRRALHLEGQLAEILKWQHPVSPGDVESLADIQKADVTAEKSHIMAVNFAVPFRQVLPFLFGMGLWLPLVDPPVVTNQQQAGRTGHLTTVEI